MRQYAVVLAGNVLSDSNSSLTSIVDDLTLSTCFEQSITISGAYVLKSSGVIVGATLFPVSFP